MNSTTRSMDAETASTSTCTENKLGPCEVCSHQQSKYCCPRCEVKTCSLKCSKIHKLEIQCDGMRDRTKFIPVNKFTNLDLSSDYRLLEEISRVLEVSKKGRSQSHKHSLSKRFLLLQQQALERKICLKFLPSTFQKHKYNTSIYDTTKKIIKWQVDWIFVNGNSLKISENVPENARLSNVINKYLTKQESPELQEKLQYYQAADLPGIKLLLKAEQKSGTKFYEVDPLFTLRELLRNKIVIEYPTIHLMLKDQATFCDIIDSDDEDCAKDVKNHIRSGTEVINKIINKSESDDSLYNSMKNLLFLTEYSDEERE